MCGRFVSMTDADGLVRFFTVDDRKADDLPASYNVAPTDPVYAVVEHDARRVLVTFRWGLVPSWADDVKVGSRMINARVESAADKPAFRTALARRRCLIPADGFYEWRKEGETKVPHLIHHVGGTPLAFAGLWEVWRDPADPEAPLLRTCTILTTAATGHLSDLHPRMPVVLDPERWAPWLDRDLTDAHEAKALLEPLDVDLLAHHAVSTEVNAVRNNHAGLLNPA
jgi:putative SOS response-associated peptidase YedK